MNLTHFKVVFLYTGNKKVYIMRLFAIICIVIGAAIIFISDGRTSYDGYLKIIGFIFLMFGLYKCTKFWVQDSPQEGAKEDDLDDHQDLASKN